MSEVDNERDATRQALRGATATILIAAYNDWPSVACLLPEVDKVLVPLGVSARVVVIDDGSTEREGLDGIAGLSLSAVSAVDAVFLASNQGNQRAVACGVAFVAEHAPADYMIVMDGDHEDKPEYIPALLGECKATGDKAIVFAGRTKRNEGAWFKVMYLAYRLVYQVATGSQISFGNFSATPRHLQSRLAHVAELWSHFPASIMRARIPYKSIPAERGKRLMGQSKMNLYRLLVHAFSGLAVYADVLAVRAMLASVLSAGMIAACALVVLLLKLMSDIPIIGWTSLIILVLAGIALQIISSAGTVLLLVLSLRQQPPMIPAFDYRRFIHEVRRLRGAQEDRPLPKLDRL